MRQPQTQTIMIGGMSCAECSAKAEDALNKLEGIESASVNFATKKANIVYDAALIRLSAIKEAVSNAGFEAFDVENYDDNKPRKIRELKIARTKLRIAAAFTTVILFFAVLKPVKNFLVIVFLELALAVSTIITLFFMFKMLRLFLKGRKNKAVRNLLKYAPTTAILERAADGSNTELEIPAEDVLPGDILVVKPGAVIPVDGIVIEGETAVNEALITGISEPAVKNSGDKVFAATVNTDGLIKFRAEKTGGDTEFSQLIKKAEDSRASHRVSSF